VEVHTLRRDAAPLHIRLDLAVALVVPDKHDNRRRGIDRRSELGQRELDAAIADKANDRPVRLAELAPMAAGRA
jgi:hypothetical protein